MTAPSSSADVGNQFVVTDWDSLLSVDQNVGFGGSAGLSSHNVGLLVSELVDCTNFSSIKHVPVFSSLSSDSVSVCSQTAAASCTSPFPLRGEHGNEMNSKGKKRKEMSECVALRPHCLLKKIQHVKTEQQKDVLLDTIKIQMDEDGNKPRSELNPDANSHYSTAKLAKGHPHHGDAVKEDYIHVRAKRGQATSSHSLAERIRRERISERMRFLQDLVPGCKKVTGKAMMLDEIINYVQSLQRQVEFLSMKLSAVNPQVNWDIEQLISKDNLCLQHGNPAIPQFGADLSINHPHLHGVVQQESMQVTPDSGELLRTPSSLFVPMAQMPPSAWDVENGLQMGFISNPPLNHTDLNAKLKLEL